jgi:hypothetical protein
MPFDPTWFYQAPVKTPEPTMSHYFPTSPYQGGKEAARLVEEMRVMMDELKAIQRTQSLHSTIADGIENMSREGFDSLTGILKWVSSGLGVAIGRIFSLQTLYWVMATVVIIFLMICGLAIALAVVHYSIKAFHRAIESMWSTIVHLRWTPERIYYKIMQPRYTESPILSESATIKQLRSEIRPDGLGSHINVFLTEDGTVVGFVPCVNPVMAPLKPQPVKEMVLASSTFSTCSRPAYGLIFRDASGSIIGNGFRYLNYVITAQHVMNSAHSWGLPDGTSFEMKGETIRTFPLYDIACFRPRPNKFSVAGIKTIKVYRPIGVNSGVQIKFYHPARDCWVSSRGAAVGEGENYRVNYTASTVPGASGSAIFAEGGLIGVHLEADQAAKVNTMMAFFLIEPNITRRFSKYLINKVPSLCAKESTEDDHMNVLHKPEVERLIARMKREAYHFDYDLDDDDFKFDDYTEEEREMIEFRRGFINDYNLRDLYSDDDVDDILFGSFPASTDIGQKWIEYNQTYRPSHRSRESAASKPPNPKMAVTYTAEEKGYLEMLLHASKEKVNVDPIELREEIKPISSETDQGEEVFRSGPKELTKQNSAGPIKPLGDMSGRVITRLMSVLEGNTQVLDKLVSANLAERQRSAVPAKLSQKDSVSSKPPSKKKKPNKSSPSETSRQEKAQN